MTNISDEICCDLGFFSVFFVSPLSHFSMNCRPRGPLHVKLNKKNKCKRIESPQEIISILHIFLVIIANHVREK